MDTACIEFYDYKAIPHLARPVLNKITDCAETLRWLSQELDNRLVEIMRAGHRNIQAYNAAGGLMPYDAILPRFYFLDSRYASLRIAEPW